MPFDVPVISLDPYLAGIQATLALLQQLGVIPDLNPLDYIIGAFDGKPKEEDTLQAAQRLQSSPWWPLQALGNNLMIWVRNGVPLSTGNPVYRAQLSEWIRGTIDSLEPIVYGRLDPGTLDHAIWLSMTSQDGASAIVELNNTIAAQRALGPLPPATPATQPPPAVPTEVGWNVNPDGDEVIDLGNTLVFQNSLIYGRLVQIAGELANSGNGDCCTNVTTAIAAITGQLTIIAAAVAALANNTPPTPSTAEADALNRIADELQNCLCRIAAAMDSPVALPPVPSFTAPAPTPTRAGLANAVLKQMIADGRLAADTGQLVTS